MGAKEKAAEGEGVVEASADGGFDISDAPSSTVLDEKKKSSKEKTTTLKSEGEPKSKSNDSEKDEKEDNSPPPVGNGGTVENKYVWTQTLQELVVSLPLPNSTRGKDLNVMMKKNHLKISLRGHPPMVDTPLTKTII